MGQEIVILQLRTQIKGCLRFINCSCIKVFKKINVSDENLKEKPFQVKDF